MAVNPVTGRTTASGGLVATLAMGMADVLAVFRRRLAERLDAAWLPRPRTEAPSAGR